MTNINFINHIIKPRKNVVRKIRVLGRQSSHISNILILTFMFFMSKKNYFVLCTFFHLKMNSVLGSTLSLKILNIVLFILEIIIYICFIVDLCLSDTINFVQNYLTNLFFLFSRILRN